ncbi:MAG: hypothetical protein R3281_09925 [Balneolaceae bacterium]|nr:hypothetical protein [Balneolaceae bacterium]
MPAGIAATSLHCDMDMPVDKGHECHSAACISHHQQEKENSTEHCPLQSICAHTLNAGQSHEPAVVNTNKILPNLPVEESLISVQDQSENTEPVGGEPEFLQPPSPPIFLVNSTFLN